MTASEMFTSEELRVRRCWLLIVGVVGLLLAVPLTLLVPFHSLFEITLLALFLLGSPTSTLVAWWLKVHRTAHLDVVDGLKAGLLAGLIGFVIVVLGLSLLLPAFFIVVVFLYALVFYIIVVAPIGLVLGATFVTLEKRSLVRLDQKRMSTTNLNQPTQESTDKSII